MNKEQFPPKNDDADQKAREQKALAAWNAWQDWKITCAVAACSRPESKIILKDQIQWAFWNKFKAIFPNNCEKIMASSKDWAYEFDTGIYSPEAKKYVDGFKEHAESHPEEAREHGKFFKDYLWSLIPQREYGSELDYIKGTLIGTRGVINQIVEYYIRREFPVLFHNWQKNRNIGPEETKKQNLSVMSLDQPVGENKSQTLMDLIADAPEYTQLSDDTRYQNEIDFKTMLEKFTWQEIACLLATVTGTLTHKTTMSFIGVNSPAAMSRFNNNKEFKEKLTEFQKYMRKADAGPEEKKVCIDLMKNRIKVEKDSEEFLNIIEPELKRIFNRIDAYYDKKYQKEEEQ